MFRNWTVCISEEDNLTPLKIGDYWYFVDERGNPKVGPFEWVEDAPESEEEPSPEGRNDGPASPIKDNLDHRGYVAMNRETIGKAGQDS